MGGEGRLGEVVGEDGVGGKEEEAVAGGFGRTEAGEAGLGEELGVGGGRGEI